MSGQSFEVGGRGLVLWSIGFGPEMVRKWPSSNVLSWPRYDRASDNATRCLASLRNQRRTMPCHREAAGGEASSLRLAGGWT
jgi:hypothetical protein